MGYYIVLAVILHVAIAQGPNIPPECRAPPPVEKPFECCEIPPFFPEEDFTECGFPKMGEGPTMPEPGPPGLPHGPRDCTKEQCVLKKYDLIKGTGDLDFEAISAFMDKYSEANPEFKEAVDLAKERCVAKDLPGPPHLCEPTKFVFCVASNLFMECPAWQEREGCDAVKQHVEKCKKHFTAE